jgi:hypothetical protein
MSSNELTWHSVKDWGVEGKGFEDTERYFDRLPSRAKNLLPEVVWNLSRSATGMACWFQTDAKAISAKWQLQSEQLGEPNFAVSGFSGVDLYAQDAGKMKWVGAGHLVKDQHPEQVLINEMSGEMRTYCLYLPIRNPVEEVFIGVPAEAKFSGIKPRKEKSLVFYGSSIVHGAYASRAGMIHPAILGRRLSLPVVNLGFSGNAKMEIELARLLGEIDAGVYILDALPNMDLPLVKDRCASFVKELKKLRPETPIILVEDRPLVNYWIKPEAVKNYEEKWKEHKNIFEKLKADGLTQLYYLSGRELWGTDADTSLDASHPSDLGFARQADALEPMIKMALSGKS